MALLFCDGFEHYGTSTTGRNNMTQGLYATAGSGGPSASVARTGNRSLEVYGSYSFALRLPILTTSNKIGWAFGLYLPDLSNSYTLFYAFMTAANGYVVTMVVTPSGELQLRTGGTTGGTIIGTTDVGTIAPATWNHIEMAVLRDNIVGEAELRLNGVTVLKLTDLNLGTADIAQIGAYSQGIHRQHIDDMIVWDDTGSINNDFFGPARVNTIFPASDTGVADWTPNTGDGYAAIDDPTQPDGDTTYIASSTTGDVSEFGLGTLPSEVDAIAGVYVANMSRLAAAGIGNLQVSLVSNSVVAAGPDTELTPIYTYRGTVVERNPDGNVPWNKATIEAALLRVEKTA